VAAPGTALREGSGRQLGCQAGVEPGGGSRRQRSPAELAELAAHGLEGVVGQLLLEARVVHDR
jgi:hypothetical protein